MTTNKSNGGLDPRRHHRQYACERDDLLAFEDRDQKFERLLGDDLRRWQRVRRSTAYERRRTTVVFTSEVTKK